ncbi:MAG: hypothetical protein ACP5UO_02445, partial [Thermoplasmata archaeon]
MAEGSSNKEYVSGRRDQFDLDLTTFWECVRETKTRDELVSYSSLKLRSLLLVSPPPVSGVSLNRNDWLAD